ncbi:MAG: hypothetical protein PHF67_05425 [Candidatus Nanoarchaeia archaeon]|nr:hypothetical protein [Candidatus Nanoarchaeia archaeon]
MKSLMVVSSEDFWIQLRKRTRVNGTTGRGFCDFWCDDALQLLPLELRYLFEKRTVFNFDSELLLNHKLFYHQWIETPNGTSARFIADGTAGQIFPEYFEGYYGFYDQSPPELRKFYSPAL